MTRPFLPAAVGMLAWAGLPGCLLLGSGSPGAVEGVCDAVDTGPLKERHPGRVVKAEGWCEGGLRHGHWVFNHPNGKPRMEGNYRMGRRDGLWLEWDEGGRLLSEGEFTMDEPSGLWRFYHANGQRSAEGSFENGERVGEWATWDDAGNPGMPVVHAPPNE